MRIFKWSAREKLREMWKGCVKPIPKFQSWFFAPIFAICCLGGRELHQQQSIDLEIQELSAKFSVKMTRRDARHLDSFFRDIFVWHGIVYTLTGTKPLSVADIPISISELNPHPFWFMKGLYSIRRYKKGWEAWKKHRHLFENERFVFWEENQAIKNSHLCLNLVDRSNFIEVVKENESEFLSLLNLDSINPEELLHECLEKDVLREALKKSYVLYGILLGYGKGNAWFFQNERDQDKFRPNPVIWSPEEIREAYAGIREKHLTFKEYEIEDIPIPMFVGHLDSEESKDLRKKYLSAKEDLVSFYEGKNFLEATLSLFRSGPEILKSERSSCMVGY